jgi:hypothetical protein
MSVECPLALADFGKSSVKVKVRGLRAGRLTMSGAGIKTVRRTITTATTAKVTAEFTAIGKRLRRAKRDVRIKGTLVPKGLLGQARHEALTQPNQPAGSAGHHTTRRACHIRSRR